MNKITCLMALALMIGFLVGCAPRALNPGAVNVRLTASIPKKCRFMGAISGTNVHGDMSLAATQQELTLDHVNFLKNQAAQLGANVVVFKSPEIVEERRLVSPKTNSYINLTTHNINGSAYLCP